MLVQLLLAVSILGSTPISAAPIPKEQSNLPASESAAVTIVDQKETSTYIDFTYPQVTGLPDVNVQKLINEKIKARVYDLQKKDAFDDFKRYYWTSYDLPYHKGQMLSVRLNQLIHAEGAAHPVNYVNSITLDLRTGKEYLFADLFKKDTAYINTVNELARKEIAKLDFTLFEPFKGVSENQAYYLTPDALVIYFQEGEYTPHAVGPLVIRIPYQELQSVLAQPY